MGDLFEVGKSLLDGLELASPFQWELAHRDLFSRNCLYAADQIETTVLVGSKDYDGLRGWVNKPGTDGTVVISGTPLDNAKLIVDYTKSPAGIAPKRPTLYEYSRAEKKRGAFGVMDGFDHGSIVEFGLDNRTVEKFVVEALTTVPGSRDFETLRTKLEKATQDVYEKEDAKPPFQQFIFRALDDYNVPVQDYSLEFFLVKKSNWTIHSGFVAEDLDEFQDPEERRFSRRLGEVLMGDPHTNSSDGSFRRILVDSLGMNQLYEEIEEAWGTNYVLGGRIHIPVTSKDVQYDTKELQNVVIYDPEDQGGTIQELFTTNTTLLVELRVRQYSGYVWVSPVPRDH